MARVRQRSVQANGGCGPIRARDAAILDHPHEVARRRAKAHRAAPVDERVLAPGRRNRPLAGGLTGIEEPERGEFRC